MARGKWLAAKGWGQKAGGNRLGAKLVTERLHNPTWARAGGKRLGAKGGGQKAWGKRLGAKLRAELVTEILAHPA